MVVSCDTWLIERRNISCGDIDAISALYLAVKADGGVPKRRVEVGSQIIISSI
jgi:hypothetical protein